MIICIIQEIDFIRIQSQKQDFNQHWGEYIIFSLNKILLINNYHKLSKYGFKIYVKIDIYF